MVPAQKILDAARSTTRTRSGSPLITRPWTMVHMAAEMERQGWQILPRRWATTTRPHGRQGRPAVLGPVIWVKRRLLLGAAVSALLSQTRRTELPDEVRDYDRHGPGTPPRRPSVRIGLPRRANAPEIDFAGTPRRSRATGPARHHRMDLEVLRDYIDWARSSCPGR